MGRGGQKPKDKRGPERTCLVCRQTYPKQRLIRFVLDPTGHVVPDILFKLPGRGVYVSAQRSFLEEAMRRNLFAREFRQPARVFEGLVDTVESALIRQVTQLMSLARKSGDAVAGFENVKAWLTQGQSKALFQASDSSLQGKLKLGILNNQVVIDTLSARELGGIFGRDRVVHASLGTGQLSERIMEEVVRLKGVRCGIGTL